MTDRGPQALSKEIELCDTDGGAAHRFPLVADRYGTLLWSQGSVPAEDAEPGEELTKTWDYFGGGSGETNDLEELLGVKTGGYFFSDDCQVTPYAIRPRQELTSVTLTNNAAEITQMFEAKSESDTKYLYALNSDQAYKVRLADQTLVNTKDFLTSVNLKIKTGTYVGDGSYTVIPIGFSPKFIIIKAFAATTAVFKTADMVNYSYKDATGAYTTGSGLDFLKLFDQGYASVKGSDAAINADGVTYRYTAFGGDSCKTGTFEGDGNDDRDVTVETDWGQPQAVFIWTDNAADHVCLKLDPPNTDLTWDLVALGQGTANIIEAVADWPTDGFEVGSDNRANRSGANVYYAALKEEADTLKVNSYTGNASATQNVTDPGLNAKYAIILSGEATNRYPVHRSDYVVGVKCMLFAAGVDQADFLEAFITNGFTVDGVYNTDGQTYYYLTVRDDPDYLYVHGQPAEWNDIWEKPNGPDVDREGLTVIADGTDNDTWTARSTGSPKADHLCVVENELIRASADRMIDKCSALDTDVDANWTGDYNVGQAGTKITSLVNAGGEVGVGTTDGFYLFDLIAQSRQQLPLLGGIVDDDNAKGATVVGNLTLVPTVAGAWRILGGSAVQFGPDANKFYTDVEGPSSIPIHLEHYGFAFLGTYIYNAVYDGTNYHIIYTQLTPNDPTLLRARWDFLLTTTNEIKALKVDSECRLWFGYGVNLAYITLLRDGKPEGGSWGETSGSGHFYLPVTRMKTDALKGFRLIEIEVDSTPANYNWSASVYLDGGSVASVGSAITSDGVGECFWTRGTSDEGREILVRVNWAGDSGFSAQSTPPEVKRVTLHADPLTEDADLIVCSVDLSENAKERKAWIDAKLNVGAIRLIDPLTGEKHTVVLYNRRVYSLTQEGNAPAKAACELRFRRSDTS